MNLNVNLSYSSNDHEWILLNLSLLMSLKGHIRLIETSMSNPVHLPFYCVNIYFYACNIISTSIIIYITNNILIYMCSL